MAEHVRNCAFEECGKEFVTHSKKKTFCDAPCRIESNRRKMLLAIPPLPPKVCEWEDCGKEFNRRENESRPHYRDRRFCSMECRMQNVRASKRGIGGCDSGRMVVPKRKKEPPRLVVVDNTVSWRVPLPVPIAGRYVPTDRTAVESLTQAQRTERRVQFRETFWAV